MTTEVRPDDPGFVDSFATGVAAYVHIPFCRRLCPYCDFAVVTTGDIAGYHVALLAEIAAAEPFDRPLDAIAFGGGTPSSIPPAMLGEIVGALDDRFGMTPLAEVGIEANPEDIDEATLAGLRSAGFGRISLGVQSFDPEVLAALGRAHTPAMARQALIAAREAFPSVNADLIFGTPGESDRSWLDSIEEAVATGVDHLSTYALTVERGTALSRAVLAGAPTPDPDAQADRYQAALPVLQAAGLVRYETSNHARPGHACVYNLITWAQGDYEAFGNGAHRHRRGRRSWNLRRVDRYIERAGDDPVAGSELRTGWDADVERVMLGLRRAAGVVAGAAGSALLADRHGQRLVEAGVLVVDGERLRIGRPLLGDEVSRALLALTPGEC